MVVVGTGLKTRHERVSTIIHSLSKLPTFVSLMIYEKYYGHVQRPTLGGRRGVARYVSVSVF